MATRSLRVRRLISPQWGQSDPPSTASAWARPRQKMHDSWPSEGSIGSTQERQSREVIFCPSEAHRNTAGEEKVCSLQRVDHGDVITLNRQRVSDWFSEVSICAHQKWGV
ncbi:hypothetical protein G5714_009970 [Onychostoma macrolepis]|uniref:Uncharacterized protein n=1 Tax=Onychostoma macrolepis TaxID=369639 RepID=A0A7J6CNK9_9TELE|nr:hypothetical protein G5714_009970 [Onychostoma macrolepis]